MVSGSGQAHTWVNPGVRNVDQHIAGDVQRPAGTVDNSRKVESNTTIQQLTVQSQATDADGIARDITASLPNRVAQADGAFGV